MKNRHSIRYFHKVICASKRTVALAMATMLALAFAAGGCSPDGEGGTDAAGAVSSRDTASYAAMREGSEEYTGSAAGTGGDGSGNSADSEEAYSRAMARKSQSYDPVKSDLIYSPEKQEAAPGRDYTIMIYMVGSNLESVGGNATKDLEEMEAAGLDYDKANLLVYTGGAQRWMGDVPCDQNSVIDLSRPAESRIRAHTDGNADMGAPETLSAFINYCTDEYPADHYALIFWDHGGGPVLGYGLDELFDDDSLLLSEMSTAMAATDFGKNKKLDFVGFDACLMGSLESMAVWENYADYYIASAETEPGAGWDYSFLSVFNDTTDAKQIAGSIVDHYADYYKASRSETSDPDVTLACSDLSKVDDILTALGDLSGRLSEDLDTGEYARIQQLRAQVKSFGNIAADAESGKSAVSYDLIDARDFTGKFSSAYPDECARLDAAVSEAVVKNYTNVENVCGLTLYFPYGNKEMYRSAAYSMRSILPSASYRSFLSDLSDSWLTAHTGDWTLAGVETGDEEYTLQLTDEQQENLTRAWYSVLRKTDDGMYMPVMNEVSLTPDRSGVLHVPKDPELIELRMEQGGESSVWGFRQISSDRKRTVYVSETTGLYKDIDFSSIRENTSPKLISIYLSQDAKTQDLHIMNVSSTSENGTAVSKDTIDVAGYSTIYNSLHAHNVEKDGKRRTKAYSDWVNSDWTWLFSYEITEVPQFTKVRASETDEEYAVQIVLEDVSGDEYGSEVLGLESNDPGERTQYSTPEGTLSFRVHKEEATVTGYTGDDTDLEIPSEVDGKPVTAIESLGNGGGSIRRLILPDSVTLVEDGACRYMSSLEEVTFPSSLQEIGMQAFYHCSSLQKIDLPDSLKNVGAEAFDSCKALQSVSLPSSCAHIGKGAFFHCDQLAEIELREVNAESAAETAAYKEVNGAILTADGKTLVAFPQASGREAVVPDGVETIGYGAFAGAGGLKKITLPDTLTKIDYMAFYDCTGLTDLRLPESLTQVEEQAFGLSPLMYQNEGEELRPGERESITIHIGKHLQSVGDGAFDAVLAHSFTVEEDNPYYSETEGTLMNKAGDQVILPAADGTASIRIPEGAVSLQWEMLDPCKSYAEPDSDYDFAQDMDTYDVYIPESVTRFDPAEECSFVNRIVFHCARGSAAWDYAENNGITHDDVASGAYTEFIEQTEHGTLTYRIYEDHASLTAYNGEDTSLTLPETVEGVPLTVIGDGSEDGLLKDEEEFSPHNETLTQVKLPSSLMEIGDYAFHGFRSLTEMELPEGLTVLGNEALPNSYKLQALPAQIEYLGEDFAYSDIEGDLELPSGLRSIHPCAFESMRGVTGFVMEDGNEAYAVRDGVLYSADGGTLVCYPPAGPENAAVPEGVTVIGEKSFKTSRVTSVTFSSSVTQIGQEAFQNVHELKEIKFSSGLQSIEKHAFDGCAALEQVCLPDTLTQIEDYAFSYCNLQTLYIPGSVETIGSCAFEGNSDLTQLELEEGVRTIEYGAFERCGNLSSVKLPDSLYSVGDDAFAPPYEHEASLDSAGTSSPGETASEAVSEAVFSEKEDKAGDSAFVLKLGTDLTRISDGAFTGLNLSAFSVDASNASFKSVDGFLTDISGEVLVACPSGLTGTVTVPEGITRMEGEAFVGCRKVTDIVIPDSVTSFGSGIFPSKYVDNRQVSTVTIHCGKGSAAEEYAVENGIPYVIQ